MSNQDESCPKEGTSKSPLDQSGGFDRQEEEVPKRARGPYDCLNWSDSEDEFVPFTQSSSPPKKVFAKKSTAKFIGKKKNGAKNKKGSSSSAKGKSRGKLNF